jgi:hypothetical protein
VQKTQLHTSQLITPQDSQNMRLMYNETAAMQLCIWAIMDNCKSC